MKNQEVAPPDRPEPTPQEASYGNARCVCGHLSSRHACDHEASDDRCFDCGCEAFAAIRPSDQALMMRAIQMCERLVDLYDANHVQYVYEQLQHVRRYADVAVPARAHQEQDEDTKDVMARSATTEIRDPQPAAVTDAGDQGDSAGTELYPAVSPLGRALRRISKGSRLSSLDVPILDDAADALDSGQAVWFALKDVLASAMPNPTEHPAMFKAWERAHAVIKKASGR